jgi:hypothetical protein
LSCTARFLHFKCNQFLGNTSFFLFFKFSELVNSFVNLVIHPNPGQVGSSIADAASYKKPISKRKVSRVPLIRIGLTPKAAPASKKPYSRFVPLHHFAIDLKTTN